jgi:soluble lytic murein transglycosylase-like protein
MPGASRDFSLFERQARRDAVNAQTETKNALTAADPSVSTVKAELKNLADAFNVPRDVVLAVAQKESNYDTTAVNDNKNAKGQVVSTDYGLMQINSKLIGGAVTGSDGKPFTISESVKTD